MRTVEIADELNMTRGALVSTLERGFKEKHLVKVAPGVFALPQQMEGRAVYEEADKEEEEEERDQQQLPLAPF